MSNPLRRTLSSICEFIVDCEHKTAPTQDHGYPSIRTTNIGRGRLDLAEVNRVSEATYREWTRRAFPQSGDLILAREAPVGNVAVVPPGLKVCLGQRTVLLRPNRKQVNPSYLCYLLLGDQIQHRFAALSSGATVAHLNLRDIRDLELPRLPPRQVQDMLADVLSSYDELIENNSRRIAILEEMAQAIYREWFVNLRFPGHEQVEMVESELGPVPAGWEVKVLGELAEEIRSSIDPRQLDPDTPYFGLEHLPRRSIALAEWGRAADVQSTKLSFRKGAILFGKIRPYFHKVGVAPVDGICSSDAIVILPKADCYFGLVLACISSEAFVAYATQTSQGTKMPRANWSVLVEYPVVLPPPQLLRRFGAIVDDVVASHRNLIFRNRNLRRTRDLLLPRLISGEVAVAALEDEWAGAA